MSLFTCLHCMVIMHRKKQIPLGCDAVQLPWRYNLPSAYIRSVHFHCSLDTRKTHYHDQKAISYSCVEHFKFQQINCTGSS